MKYCPFCGKALYSSSCAYCMITFRFSSKGIEFMPLTPIILTADYVAEMRAEQDSIIPKARSKRV